MGDKKHWWTNNSLMGEFARWVNSGWNKQISLSGRINTKLPGLGQNEHIVVRPYTDSFTNSDAMLEKFKADIDKCSYSIKLVMNHPKLTEIVHGVKTPLKLTCLRSDQMNPGTKKMQPWTWGDDLALGVLVCAEKVPKGMDEIELQDRIQTIEFESEAYALSAKTLSHNLRFKFIRGLTEFIEAKFVNDFEKDPSWQKYAGGVAFAAAAVGGLCAYGIYKAQSTAVDAVADTGTTIVNAAGGEGKSTDDDSSDSGDDDSPGLIDGLQQKAMDQVVSSATGGIFE